MKGLSFSYQQYKNEALGEVLARQAIVGLGISGNPEAMKNLNMMKQKSETRKDWQDNLDEAIKLNDRVKKQGAKSVFGKKSN